MYDEHRAKPLDSAGALGAESVPAGCRAVKGSDLRHSPTCRWLAGLWHDRGTTTSTAALTTAQCCQRWGEGCGQPAYLAAGKESSRALPKMFAEAQPALWPAGWLSPQRLFTGDHWGFQIPRRYYALFSVFRGFLVVMIMLVFFFFSPPKNS